MLQTPWYTQRVTALFICLPPLPQPNGNWVLSTTAIFQYQMELRSQTHSSISPILWFEEFSSNQEYETIIKPEAKRKPFPPGENHIQMRIECAPKRDRATSLIAAVCERDGAIHSAPHTARTWLARLSERDNTLLHTPAYPARLISNSRGEGERRSALSARRDQPNQKSTEPRLAPHTRTS